MANTEGKKCAHPICSCTVTSGKYCSTQCETIEKTPDIDCKCGHVGLQGPDGISRLTRLCSTLLQCKLALVHVREHS